MFGVWLSTVFKDCQLYSLHVTIATEIVSNMHAYLIQINYMTHSTVSSSGHGSILSTLV